jgi:lipopolysaccharide/colanic/teichoic acid biosynthesis glycosyltransferase
VNFNYDYRETHPLLYKLIHQSYLYKFPILINILMGEMSLVGPRPETPESAEKIKKKIKFYNRRFQVKPGLCGWSQVRYRYSDSMRSQREMLKHDLFYLENFSLSFDLRILMRSLFLFFFRITK